MEFYYQHSRKQKPLTSTSSVERQLITSDNLKTDFDKTFKGIIFSSGVSIRLYLSSLNVCTPFKISAFSSFIKSPNSFVFAKYHFQQVIENSSSNI